MTAYTSKDRDELYLKPVTRSQSKYLRAVPLELDHYKMTRNDISHPTSVFSLNEGSKVFTSCSSSYAMIKALWPKSYVRCGFSCIKRACFTDLILESHMIEWFNSQIIWFAHNDLKRPILKAEDLTWTEQGETHFAYVSHNPVDDVLLEFLPF